MIFNSKPVGTVYHGDGTRTEYYSNNDTGIIIGETKGTKYSYDSYSSPTQFKTEEPTLFTKFLMFICGLFGMVAMIGAGLFVLEIAFTIIYFIFFH